MSAKLDLTKTFKQYYAAKDQPALVEFGEVPYLSIEGSGEPAGEQFTAAVETLYPLAYGVKKICKGQDQDFGVPKLEGLWWVDSDRPALEVPRSQWCWKLLIRMPEFVTQTIYESARDDVLKKKGLALVKETVLESLNERACIQIMHVGPYSTEPQTVDKMKAFMDEKGLVENGLHHEIYISDPRKTAPEK